MGLPYTLEPYTGWYSPFFLFRDEMRNAFNLLLISLLGFDSWFLLGCILENVRRNFDLASNLHILLFPYFLYPTAMVAMTGSIFMTVAISLERYFAVHHPIGKTYTNKELSGILWISYWKIKVKRSNKLHFKAFGMINLQYERRIW